MTIDKIFKQLSGQEMREITKPMVFDLKKKNDQKTVIRLLQDKKILHVVDEIGEQQKELMVVNNPEILKTHSQSTEPLSAGSATTGNWIYYPWKFSLVHILKKDDYLKLKVSRNYNLILPAEQEKFQNFHR